MHGIHAKRIQILISCISHLSLYQNTWREDDSIHEFGYWITMKQWVIPFGPTDLEFHCPLTQASGLCCYMVFFQNKNYILPDFKCNIEIQVFHHFHFSKKVMVNGLKVQKVKAQGGSPMYNSLSQARAESPLCDIRLEFMSF